MKQCFSTPVALLSSCRQLSLRLLAVLPGDKSSIFASFLQLHLCFVMLSYYIRKVQTKTGSHHAILCVQPSISFEQQVASQALVSLQFGQQVIPGPTDRRSSDRRSPQGKGAVADDLLQTRYLLPSVMMLALTCVPLTACLPPS